MSLKYVTGPITKADAGGLEAVISTPKVDTDGEVVEPLGLKNRDEYLTNPLVYWAHEWALTHGTAEPIGQATRLDVSAKAISSAAIFAPTPKAQNIRALVLGGFVRKTSIGFDIEPGGVVIKAGTPHIVAWALKEWSVVPMPANTDASISGTKAALRWYADQIADVEEAKDALHASMTPDEIVALVKAAVEDRLTLTYSESPSPLRDAPPIVGVTVRDGKRVIADIRRRRVLHLSS